VLDPVADYLAFTTRTDMMTGNEISRFVAGIFFAHGTKKIAKQVGYFLGDPKSFHVVPYMEPSKELASFSPAYWGGRITINACTGKLLAQ